MPPASADSDSVYAQNIKVHSYTEALYIRGILVAFSKCEQNGQSQEASLADNFFEASADSGACIWHKHSFSYD